MKKYTAKQKERFNSLVNDIAEDMDISKKWGHTDLENCIAYLADELYMQRQDFNDYHGKLVSIASKMFHDIVVQYPKPTK